MPDYIVGKFTDATGEAALKLSAVPNTQIASPVKHASIPKLEGGANSELILLEGNFNSIVSPMVSAIYIRAPRAGVLTRVDVWCTASTGGESIFDVNRNGVTLFANPANRLQIAAGASLGTVNLSQAVAFGDRLTIDCDLPAPSGGVIAPIFARFVLA